MVRRDELRFGPALDGGADGGRTSGKAALKEIVLTCLAITWLNPHVYLDTVFLIGAVSTQFPGSGASFAAGAMTGSFVFFFAARLRGQTVLITLGVTSFGGIALRAPWLAPVLRWGGAAFLGGLSVVLSLIIAIGAQNAFVLRQGLRDEHVLAVVLICSLSDANSPSPLDHSNCVRFLLSSNRGLA